MFMVNVGKYTSPMDAMGTETTRVLIQVYIKTNYSDIIGFGTTVCNLLRVI